MMLNEIKVQFHLTRWNNPPFSNNKVRMALFTNPGGPLVATMTKATLDALAPTYTGYAVASLTTWSVPVLGANGKAQMSSTSSASFTNTGVSDSAPIYGWWLWDADTNKAIQANLFVTPMILTPGITYTAVPFYTLTGDD